MRALEPFEFYSETWMNSHKNARLTAEGRAHRKRAGRQQSRNPADGADGSSEPGRGRVWHDPAGWEELGLNGSADSKNRP